MSSILYAVHSICHPPYMASIIYVVHYMYVYHPLHILYIINTIFYFLDNDLWSTKVIFVLLCKFVFVRVLQI